MSQCPWGHQLTGTLRLEYPRAQGGCIILACSTLRSPKSTEWVQDSHSKPNSCHETGTERRQQEAPRDPVLLLTCHLGALSTHWAPFLQAQTGAWTSPGRSVLAAQGHCFLPDTTKTSPICTLHGAEQLARPHPLTTSQ